MLSGGELGSGPGLTESRPWKVQNVQKNVSGALRRTRPGPRSNERRWKSTGLEAIWEVGSHGPTRSTLHKHDGAQGPSLRREDQGSANGGVPDSGKWCEQGGWVQRTGGCQPLVDDGSAPGERGYYGREAHVNRMGALDGPGTTEERWASAVHRPHVSRVILQG